MVGCAFLEASLLEKKNVSERSCAIIQAMYEELLQIFRDDLADTEKAQNIYAALCNNVWKKQSQKINLSWRAAGGVVADMRNDLDLPLEDEDMCQLCQKSRSEHFQITQKTFLTELLRKNGESLVLTFPGCDPAGDNYFTSGYTGPEDYMDFYCTGNEGVVAPWVQEKMLSAGWKNSSEEPESTSN